MNQSNYTIEKVFKNAINQINEFTKHHKEEHFYAFAIDSGMLCLSSEEGFQKIVEQYSKDWLESNKKAKSREHLLDDEIEIIKDEYEFCKKSTIGKNQLDSNKITNLEEYIEYWLKIENKVRERNLRKGNPYINEERIEAIKYNTGNWPYQGFGNLNFESDETSYETKEKTFNYQSYREFTDKLLDLFDKNKDMAFSQLKRTPDFKIIKTRHIY
ncbi:hypothetical protein FLAVO9AF_120069 [Flavobacterium sp. 9AF]|uniref:hypothetical protein n=1 Tax=Flavobacterium sp. 9AF TaxID=2653142 RepID=UPI0012F24F9E|nr:hypothetical protein [Flavobacterium sp. 9AF]VXB20280.1 hypothetical protein FLAVO9AF_120069 [Flavobacterium sp. 9AF]